MTTTDPAAEDTTVRVHDAMQALAFVGDLSMGQPCNHSRRVAALAQRLAQAVGRAELAADATSVALLRWSGCTANAGEIAALIGDDVAGRAKMLAEPAVLAQLQAAALTDPAQRERLAAFAGVAQIHCEVAGDIAHRLGLPAAVEQALRHVFDGYNLEGEHEAATELVAIVTLCGEFEIATRLHGADAVPAAGERHSRPLVEALRTHARGWLAALDAEEAHVAPQVPESAVPLALLADVVDLKLPWLTGHSRTLASAVAAAGPRIGLDAAAVRRTTAAALLHGMGRAALPNALWNKQAPLTRAEREQVRLAAYWTARAARELTGLSAEAELASWVFERADGSGHFRGLAPQGAEAQLLAAAASWVALRSPRPWRPAFSEPEAAQILRDDARAGRYEGKAVEALLGAPAPRHHSAAPAILSPRELDVLRTIAHGASNKEAAQRLGISPATVRTHLEHVFEKLACSSRAAATLKAAALGLL